MAAPEGPGALGALAWLPRKGHCSCLVTLTGAGPGPKAQFCGRWRVSGTLRVAQDLQAPDYSQALSTPVTCWRRRLWGRIAGPDREQPARSERSGVLAASCSCGHSENQQGPQKGQVYEL